MRFSTSQSRLAVGFFHTIAALCLACGGDRAEVDATHQFRAALLTPGPISDRSWNAAAYDGLRLIRDSLDADISHIQTRTPAEFDENFRQYGAQGYDLVIGHGFEFQDAAQRVAPAFPRTRYVTTGGTGIGPNIASMSFAFDEPSYLAGMAAASVTRTKRLGLIGGTELPPVKASFDAFAEGARAVDPEVQVITAYLGNWDDAGAGKEQALAFIARGADVIFQNADAAGLGIFQAVRESPNTWIIGSNADQNDVAPTVTLGSVLIDVPRAFLLVAREVKEGTFTGRVIRYDTSTDVVRWVPNPAVDVVPASIRARIDSTRARLAAHEFAPRAGPP